MDSSFKNGTDVNAIGTSGYVDGVTQLDGVGQVDPQEAADYAAPDIQPPSASFANAPTDSPTKRRLTGADIRKKNDIVTENVDVWDGFVTMKALTAKERDSFESAVLVKKGKSREFSNANIRAKLVVRCAVDEFGHRVWADEDAEWLGDKSAPEVDKMYAVAARLSGITEADADELEKNSKSVAGEDS